MMIEQFHWFNLLTELQVYSSSCNNTLGLAILQIGFVLNLFCLNKIVFADAVQTVCSCSWDHQTLGLGLPDSSSSSVNVLTYSVMRLFGSAPRALTWTSAFQCTTSVSLSSSHLSGVTSRISMWIRLVQSEHVWFSHHGGNTRGHQVQLLRGKGYQNRGYLGEKWLHMPVCDPASI